ncbi:MAG: glycosyltransferase family 2 protein [Acidimicrobiia bacterium]
MSDSLVPRPAGAQPSVSTVIATRDRPELLRRAVGAILGQKYDGPLEVVVVFDQSEVTSVDVEVPEGRALRLVPNEGTPGLAGARNAGAAAASGELLAFCDDDDEWLPGKLDRQVTTLMAAPAALVATTGIFVCYRGKATPRVSGATRVSLADLLRSRVMEAHPSTVLVRRDAFFGAIGPVDEHIPGSYAEDYEWLLRAARAGEIAVVPAPLVNVYWHQSSWFSDRWKTIISALGYLVDKYPEFNSEPKGLARIYGQIAFAHAASGERALARSWARRCLGLHWKERRAYLALLVSSGLIGPQAIQRVAHTLGKGI